MTRRTGFPGRAAAAFCLLLAVAFRPASGDEQSEGQQGSEDLFAHGMALYGSGEFNGAAAAFLQAASRRQGYLEAHYFAGKSLLKGDPTDLAGAEAQFLEVLRINPDHLDGRIALAQAYYEWGRYEKARAALAEVLKRSPDHRGALHYSGVTAARLGEHEKAVSHFRAALARDSAYIPSRLELGLSLSHMGREEEALAAFEEVLRAEPGNERALFGAGTAQMRLGRSEEGRAMLVKFREAATATERREWKEKRVQLWLQQARKHLTEGRRDEARKAVDRLLEEYPDEPRGLAGLGYLLEKAGEESAAIATYEKTLVMDPDNLTANRQLVDLYLRAGARDRAAARKAHYEELLRKAADAGRD